MINNKTLKDHKNVRNSHEIHIVLLAITFLIIINISGAFIYF